MKRLIIYILLFFITISESIGQIRELKFYSDSYDSAWKSYYSNYDSLDITIYNGLIVERINKLIVLNFLEYETRIDTGKYKIEVTENENFVLMEDAPQKGLDHFEFRNENRIKVLHLTSCLHEYLVLPNWYYSDSMVLVLGDVDSKMRSIKKTKFTDLQKIKNLVLMGYLKNYEIFTLVENLTIIGNNLSHKRMGKIKIENFKNLKLLEIDSFVYNDLLFYVSCINKMTTLENVVLDLSKINEIQIKELLARIKPKKSELMIKLIIVPELHKSVSELILELNNKTSSIVFQFEKK